MLWINRTIAVSCLFTGTILALGGARADDSELSPRSKIEKAGSLEPDRQEPLYRFEVSGNSMDSVFQWVTDATGIEVLTNGGAGLHHFVPPAGKCRRYTLDEICEYIND